ncbi:MAG: YegS/Rv2252/BmrU family lipid kinase [Chloroflexi bacterium]|nr:YegS/Rv2252/BmrU family lipid kinase [Chloroflexota bacterium]
MTRRALFVLNPAARRAPRPDRLRAALAGLEGWESGLLLTASPGHATALAREAAAQGLDAVVACGGDGTVNEVANGLARSGTALAVVRGGTGNVWAKEVRVPRNPARAARLLVDGETRTVDLGRAGERYFLLMAGVGFDGDVVRGLPSGAKRRLGAASYIAHGLRRALSYRAAESDLTLDHERLATELYWLLLGNTRSYGGVLNLTHLARADDGKLDLLLLRRGGLLRFVSLIPWVLLRRHHRRRALLYREVTSLDVATAGLPVQVDGEYLTETPLRFEVAPAALRVIVPRGLTSPLFSDRR